jgi:hypothetical protein
LHLETLEERRLLSGDPPLAVDDSYTVLEDRVLAVDVADGVLANDTDAESDPLTAILSTGPATGTLTFNDDGSFEYSPDADFNGTDSFTYVANDGTSDSAEATVTITIEPVVDSLVDVKPGSNVNPINLRARGVLPVAILSTQVSSGEAEDLDATTIDPATILLGDVRDGFGRVEPLRVNQEDVDGDGDLDLILHFSLPELVDAGAIDPDTTELLLTAVTEGGDEVAGTDHVRIVPDNSHAVVDKLYQQALSRPAEAQGLEHWAGRIQRGESTPGEVASQIFESNERLDPLIRQMYRDYLFREADEAGVAFWRDQVWKRDGGPDNVIAGIVSSPEFFQAAGGTNRAWVSQVYDRLLERGADNAGLAFWASRLDSRALSRQQVVLGFVRGDESFRLLIDDWFSLYLERTPGEREVVHFLLQLHRGATQRSIQIEIINSAEYTATA